MVKATELWPGKLVRIHDVGAKLRTVAVRHAPDAEEFRYRLEEGQCYDCLLDGQTGQCLESWDAEAYIVRTVEGHVASVPVENLDEFEPEPATYGGFDVAWPADDDGGAGFGIMVGQVLDSQGYCVVQMFTGSEEQQEAMDDSGKVGELSEFKEELEVDFLGRDNYTKAKKLKPDNLDEEPSDALGQYERQLSQIGMMVGPLTPALFGFETIGRSASFLRTRFSNKAEAERLKPQPLERDDIEDGAVSNHVRFVQSRKLCMLYTIHSEGGELWLYPREGQDVMIPVIKGRIVIFRHDRMSYSYKPLGNSLALQSWIVRDVPGFQVEEVTGGGQEVDRVMEVEGPPRQDGRKFHIMSMHTRFPGESTEPDKYWSMVSQCTDSVTDWPFMRFEHSLYYSNDVNAALMGKSYTNHGGFLTYAQLTEFGNEFFRISEAEAWSMSWNQRNSCEVSYEALWQAGWTRETLHGKHIGFYVGDVGSDWHSMTPFASIMAYNPDTTATAVSSAIVPTRISFVFNLIGPTMTFDTACSASLVGTHHAHVNMINFWEWGMPCDGSICGGTNTLAPAGFVGNCSANMLSHIGRSFTFDRTADGYQRGEGTAFMFCKLTAEYKDSVDRLAVLAGSCANQDGRSASLTAPNGPSQQAVLRHSLRFAGIEPEAVTVVECHGTGTALGDPIEVGAVMAVMEGERDDPLPHTSAKSNIAHLESAAGIAGLLKCLVILLHSCATPNVHLRALNPHLESAGFPQLFEVEIVHTQLNAGYCGVSSFGFGGTNSRGDLYGKAIVGPSAKTEILPQRIDVISIPCPRCMGDMCGRCAVAVPGFSMKQRHFCELVRDDLADYEFCSNCYNGEFRYGSTIEDVAKCDPNYQICITGSWSAWLVSDEMEMVDYGVYVCAVELGETKIEHFQLNVFQNSNNAIYPATPEADTTIRIEGPDDGGKGKHWVIDARGDENVASGTIYQVTFTWGEKKEIKWEVMDEKPMFALGQEFQHSYSITGSFIKWGLQEMKPGPTEGTWEVSFSIGPSGREEFQFVRDRDSSQTIYPAKPRTEIVGVPVRGPDALGGGKNWLVRGTRRETITVQLQVVNGQITVTTSGLSEETAWTNKTDESYHTYCLTGGFNNWSSTKMTPDEKRHGVFTSRLLLEDNIELFQVIRDEDPQQTLHPSNADALCGQDLVQGPDDKGSGLNWMILGEPGSAVEITVDPYQQDKRLLVSWKPVASAMLDDS
uniref:Type I polyketide synthase n=1 Tax=Gambierdiscus excentricus TaxID=986170 RepID=A0A1S6K8F7_9DINO|nr:type I polyketide synthase [Gambierdiscus excentricus]